MHTNTLLNKFCNLLMRSGNKSTAQLLLTKGFAQFLRLTTNHLAGQEDKENKNFGDTPKKVGTFRPVKNVINQGADSTPPGKQSLYLVSSEGSRVPGCALVHPKGGSRENIDRKQRIVLPEGLLHRLIENVRPCVEVRRVRVARATYQVPAQISKEQGQTRALRWIIEFANKRRQKDGISLAQALAQELLLAHRKQGAPRQRRSEVHRLAEANRSYARYRWW